MAKASELKQWFEPLGGGMNQKVEGAQIPFGEAKLLYNITHDNLGSWTSRKGITLAATTLVGTGGTQGLTSYLKLFGPNTVLYAGDRNLYFYNGVDTLTQIGADDQFQSGAKVNFCNFLNRAYIFSSSSADIVKYTDGTSIFNLGSTTNQFSAKWGISAQNTLWIGGIASNPDRIYVSLYDEGNNTPTDQMWNDGQSFPTSTRFFTVDGANTGMMSFKDQAYAFTDHSLWTFDIQSLEQFSGPQKRLDIGCVAHRTIAVDPKLGIAMWTDGKRGVYFWTGAGDPYNVAEKITNYDDAVMDLIQDGNIAEMDASIFDGKYFLSLGDLSNAGLSYYQDAQLVYDIAANKWSIRNTDMAALTSQRVASGVVKLYGGSRDTLSLYEMEVESDVDQDQGGNNVEIGGTIQTKDFGGEFGQIGDEKMWDEVRVAYSGTSDNVVVGFALDGSDTYTDFFNLSAAVSNRDTRHKMLPRSCKSQTISLQFNWTSGTFKLLGLGLSVGVDTTTGKRPGS